MKGGYSYKGNALEIFRNFMGTDNPYCDISMPIISDANIYKLTEEEKAERDKVLTVKCTIDEFRG
jgi:replication-associated recombination protein RarA